MYSGNFRRPYSLSPEVLPALSLVLQSKGLSVASAAARRAVSPHSLSLWVKMEEGVDDSVVL